MPFLHSREPALLGRRKALSLDGLDVDDHGAIRHQRLAQRAAQSPHVVAVHHTDVGEIELLEQETRRPERLERFLELWPEALDSPADARGQLRQARLERLARLVAFGIEADAVEVA
jgi:hypothetical protein